MEKNEIIAYRILAAMHPDKKPSEVKKIIEEALSKEAAQEDIELWMIIAKEKAEIKQEDTSKKVIEEHHYYHHYSPWTTYYTTDINSCAIDSSISSTLADSSITISASACER